MTKRKEAIGKRDITETIWLDGEPYPSATLKEETVYKTICVCDWCGKESGEDFLPDEIGRSFTSECQFYESIGTYSYDGSFGWQIEDLCMDCIEKLKKLLEDNGIKISEVDW